VQRPRLLICGPEGTGQAHLGPAVLYALEGLPVHAIGLPSLLSDAGARAPEEALVHAVVEARRAAPAVLFLPHLQVRGSVWCVWAGRLLSGQADNVVAATHAVACRMPAAPAAACTNGMFLPSHACRCGGTPPPTPCGPRCGCCWQTCPQICPSCSLPQLTSPPPVRCRLAPFALVCH
jgi:hypothetical protein